MKDITVQPDITIRQAMKVLNQAAEKCLLVVDANRKLLGSLTDGDLRRGILSGINFSENISECFHKDTTTFTQGNYTQEDATRVLLDKEYDLIPIIDKDGKLVDCLTLSNINSGKQYKKALEDVSVVIMAGGKGTRMEPFTKVLPKPLVPVHEKPIIEHVVNLFPGEKDVKFICNDMHLKETKMREILNDFCPHGKIYEVIIFPL